mmetsp:Transcript_9132/g.19702  ORF Transcript_9132/g.19702 Transcript_9132/m.19702 type:complete len:241 (-) Transcript_9132:1233-1955(-)
MMISFLQAGHLHVEPAYLLSQSLPFLLPSLFPLVVRHDGRIGILRRVSGPRDLRAIQLFSQYVDLRILEFRDLDQFGFGLGQLLLKLQYGDVLLAGVDLVVLVGAYFLELFQFSNIQQQLRQPRILLAQLIVTHCLRSIRQIHCQLLPHSSHHALALAPLASVPPDLRRMFVPPSSILRRRRRRRRCLILLVNAREVLPAIVVVVIGTTGSALLLRQNHRRRRRFPVANQLQFQNVVPML